MPAKSDQKVLKLQTARIELNALIEKLIVEKEALESYLTKMWGPDKFAEYQKNKGIINQVEFDASFKKYQSLDEKHQEVGDDGMTEQDLEEYRKLLEHFSAYRHAIKDKDVVSVRRACADRLAAIDKCAEEMMQGVAMYEEQMADVVATVKETTGLTEQDVKGLERVLHLYAVINCRKTSITKSEPRLLLSERLEAVSQMKKSELFENFKFVNLLMADCVHLVHKHLLWEYKQLDAGEFTTGRAEVYQCQNINITESRTVLTLDDAIALIENAAINYTLIKNLAAIDNEKIEASVIEQRANQKFAEVLAESPDVDIHNLEQVYDIRVDRNGTIVSSNANIMETEDRLGKIRQDKEAMSLPYPIEATGFPYDQNKPIVTKWVMREEKSLNGTLFEIESA